MPMDASQAVPVFGTFSILVAIALSIVVRLGTAAFSPCVRSSVLHHPAIHISWLIISFLSAVVLVLWLYPHFANRS